MNKGFLLVILAVLATTAQAETNQVGPLVVDSIGKAEHQDYYVTFRRLFYKGKQVGEIQCVLDEMRTPQYLWGDITVPATAKQRNIVMKFTADGSCDRTAEFIESHPNKDVTIKFNEEINDSLGIEGAITSVNGSTL